MTDLGTLGGSYSIALRVNDRGDIVGEAETAAGEIHGLLYRDGAMRDLTAPQSKFPLSWIEGPVVIIGDQSAVTVNADTVAWFF